MRASLARHISLLAVCHTPAPTAHARMVTWDSRLTEPRTGEERGSVMRGPFKTSDAFPAGIAVASSTPTSLRPPAGAAGLSECLGTDTRDGGTGGLRAPHHPSDTGAKLPDGTRARRA
jgi:hypothetical protein